MAQFDVHPNPVLEMRDGAPFVLDLQSNQLAALPTRIVAPLARLDGTLKLVRNLNPLVEVKGESLAVMPHLAAALPAKVLEPPIASLEARRHDIVAALDFLFTGI